MLKLLWFSTNSDSSTSTWRHWLFVLFVVTSLIDHVVEIALEFAAGESLLEMLDDSVILILAIWLSVLILLELARNHQSITQLRNQLGETRSQLQQIDARSTDLGRQYREVMQKQFDAWQLTDSEQEITIALLKGLSFREIAAVRDTREKTVRQQATSVYRKSGLKGRHELAAWFFEDLLEPAV